MTLDLTPQQFQALVGMLDVAIKQVGIRAMEDDIVGLMAAVKATAKASEMEREAA
jgi:hypothetical protein